MPIIYELLGQFRVPEHQAPATLNQANPVQNTWYTILDTTRNVIIYGIAVNIEDTNEDLEIQITIDGQTLTGAEAGVTHSTEYWVYARCAPITRTVPLVFSTSLFSSTHKYALLRGASVKVEVRKTSNNGVGNLTGIVDYGKW